MRPRSAILAYMYRVLFLLGGRVTLLGVDKVGELDGVAEEEDRGVVADHVPVALLGVELDGKAAGVASRIARALLATDGREAGEDGGLGAGGAQELGGRQLGQVSGDLCAIEGWRENEGICD
jgi:hypothetical protein